MTGFELAPDLDGAWWLATGAPYADAAGLRGRPRQDGA